MEFEWDESKATANLKKHGVSFEEAKTVFDNALAIIFDDEAHSVGEKREIMVEHYRNNRLLLISFTERSEDVAQVFTTPESVNKVLRALIEAMPQATNGDTA